MLLLNLGIGLTTKVHIVVPQINYNHRYTTHLEFEKQFPTLADAVKAKQC